MMQLILARVTSLRPEDLSLRPSTLRRVMTLSGEDPSYLNFFRFL